MSEQEPTYQPDPAEKIFSVSDCLSADSLTRYHQKEMDPEEQLAVEKHLVDCELCSDALEGMAEVSDTAAFNASIDGLNHKIQAITGTGRRKIILLDYKKLAAVAALLVILVGSFVYFNRMIEQGDGNIAEQLDPEVPTTESNQMIIYRENSEASLNKENGAHKQSSLGLTANNADLETADQVTTHDNFTTISSGLEAKDDLAKEKKMMDETTVDKLKEEKESLVREEDDAMLDVKPKVDVVDNDFIAEPSIGGMADEVETEAAPAPEPMAEKQLSADEEMVEDAISTSEIRGSRIDATETKVETTGKGRRGKKSKAQGGSTRAPATDAYFADGVSEEEADKKVEIYTTVEEMPQYPGGDEAMKKYLQDNLKYPETAKNDQIEGKVVVGFVVDKKGKIQSPRIVRSISPELDQEALRVIKSMPKWTPGKQKGKKVAVSYNVPINFKIDQ